MKEKALVKNCGTTMALRVEGGLLQAEVELAPDHVARIIEVAAEQLKEVNTAEQLKLLAQKLGTHRSGLDAVSIVAPVGSGRIVLTPGPFDEPETGG